MDDRFVERMALFKFAVIAPVVNQTHGDGPKMAYFRKMAAESHQLPDGRLVRYSPHTLKHWHQDYVLGGFDALRKAPRRDKGRSRTLTDAQKARIDQCRHDFPLLPATTIYRRLVQEGHLQRQAVSLSTVQRYVHQGAGGRPSDDAAKQQRLAYEMEYANDCWQADTCYLPAIPAEGGRQRTYLVCILDDASRLPVHSEIFLADNAVNFQRCLHRAIAKYGVPKRLYVDNGSPYKNEQLSLICAGLGIVLIHSRVRQPQGKGKQERMFRTVQQDWVRGEDFSRFTSLEPLNEAYQTWLQQSYVNRPHRGLGDDSPRERFLRDHARIRRLPPETLEQQFLHRVDRRVATDSTIQLDRNVFEVPHRFIGQKVKVRYLPADPACAYLYDDRGVCLCRIHPVRKVDNSRIRRQNPIDYTQTGGESHG